MDAALDRRVKRGVGGDVICQHLIHNVLAGGPSEEVWIPIATRHHEVVLGDLVWTTRCGQVNGSSSTGSIGGLPHCACDAIASHGLDVIREAQTRDLREAPIGS